MFAADAYLQIRPRIAPLAVAIFTSKPRCLIKVANGSCLKIPASGTRQEWLMSSREMPNVVCVSRWFQAEELGLFGNLVGGQGSARQLDHVPTM